MPRSISGSSPSVSTASSAQSTMPLGRRAPLRRYPAQDRRNRGLRLSGVAPGDRAAHSLVPSCAGATTSTRSRPKGLEAAGVRLRRYLLLCLSKHDRRGRPALPLAESQRTVLHHGPGRRGSPAPATVRKESPACSTPRKSRKRCRSIGFSTRATDGTSTRCAKYAEFAK